MNRRNRLIFPGLLGALAALSFCDGARAADLDLTDAVIVTPAPLTGPESKAVAMLVEEVQKRTLVRWRRAAVRPADSTPVIVVGSATALKKPGGAKGAAEGYRLWVEQGKGAPTVWVVGNDTRGVLFGVGRLLRAMRMERGKVTLPADFQADSAPRTALRGHQLGYRPKTNSYDGWTLPLWEQYLRDLAVFGTNAIELIPPRSDDDDDSPHFPLPKIDMMVGMSRLAADYGLEVWIWYPALDKDYSDPKTVEFALKEWGDVFRKLPRIDAVVVPGGDPGSTPPTLLFPLLEKQATNLRRYHPKAQMWVSGQGFNGKRMEEFFDLLKREPAWLAGVVAGPQVRMSLADFRARVPRRYPVRDYPDITHSRHCQYPAPDWDVAFALTESREGSNPRPRQFAHIFRVSRPHTAGFITYSEGCHDDVNKVVWSALGWDEKADVREVLREYARYFVGPALEERFADGLLGLEKNWEGPLLGNEGVESTFKAFQAMERAAGPAVKLSWRFQQGLYRAYYDAHLRARLIHERAAESAALAKLREARKLGSLRAMAEAEAILDRVKTPVAADRRQRVFELAEGLFQSIRMQLSVPRYQAIAVERGATLDTLDVPLSDAGWLRQQIAVARKEKEEARRLALLDAAMNRTDPGPGGFYDDLGDPARQPRLVRGEGFAKDPDFFASSLVGFSFRGMGPDPSRPRAWWHHAEALYDAPLRMRYPGLNRSAAYRLRVVYGMERKPAKVRLVAGDLEVHDYLSRPFEELEFDVPARATAGGELTLTWTGVPGIGGTGRGCQVCEVWLLKR